MVYRVIFIGQFLCLSFLVGEGTLLQAHARLKYQGPQFMSLMEAAFTTQHARSTIDCARQCMLHRECVSFMYANSDRLCYLYDISYPVEQRSAIGNKDMEYYSINEGNLQLTCSKREP